MDYFVSSRDERFGYNAAIKDSLEQLKLPTTTADHFPGKVTLKKPYLYSLEIIQIISFLIQIENTKY